MPKYTTVDNIPAKVFFEILKTHNYQLLRPKPNAKGLEKLFLEIYEDWFVRIDDKEAQEYIKTHIEIARLTYKVNTIKQVLHFIYTLPPYAMGFKAVADIVINMLDGLEKHMGISIDINNILLDEIHRILTVELGIIQNDISYAEMTLQSIQTSTDKTIFDYYDSLVQISSVYPYGKALDEKMTLAMYIAERKEASRRIKAAKTQKR